MKKPWMKKSCTLLTSLHVYMALITTSKNHLLISSYDTIHVSGGYPMGITVYILLSHG
jgi:hypothetical protein